MAVSERMSANCSLRLASIRRRINACRSRRSSIKDSMSASSIDSASISATYSSATWTFSSITDTVISSSAKLTSTSSSDASGSGSGAPLRLRDSFASRRDEASSSDCTGAGSSCSGVELICSSSISERRRIRLTLRPPPVPIKKIIRSKMRAPKINRSFSSKLPASARKPSTPIERVNHKSVRLNVTMSAPLSHPLVCLS